MLSRERSVSPLFRLLTQAYRRLPGDLSRQGLPTPTPTLPIILASLIVGLGSGVLGYYLVYAIFQLSVQWSAALATLALVGGVSGTAASLSALHDPPTIGMNVGFSCALTFLLLSFTGFCLVVGVFAATLALLI
jgi:hypothetical protein